MLTRDMVDLIHNFSAGSVATVKPDGTPSVSPKATFVVVDSRTIAYGDIRSPGTARNLANNPAVEVCFTDIVTRRAVRVSGNGRACKKADATPEVQAAFTSKWGDYIDSMSSFVIIDVCAAELILSPAYDRGLTAAELRESNLAHLNSL